MELSLPCTYDFEVAASKYLHALRDGSIPVVLLFSGTVFTRGCPRVRRRAGAVGPRGPLRAPGRVWRELMDQHFPGTGWLRLDHETLARLAAYKASRGHTTDDDTMAALLAARRGREGR